MIYLFGKQHAYYSYTDGDGWDGGSDDDSTDAEDVVYDDVKEDDYVEEGDYEDTNEDIVEDMLETDDIVEDMLETDDVGEVSDEIKESIKKKDGIEEIKITSRDKKKIKKKKPKEPVRKRPERPRSCPNCIWNGRKWVEPSIEKSIVKNIVENSSGEKEEQTKVLPSTKRNLYKTISCPCSSYAVYNSNGQIGCERNNFGNILYISPISMINHTIEGIDPKIGDKWRCTQGLKCRQDNFEWNTFHVVKVEENKTDITSSLVNSIYSIENCYIPKSTIRDYVTKKDDYIDPHVHLDGIDINNPKTTVNNKPLFETTEQAIMWNYLKGDLSLETSEFLHEDTVKFLPGKSYPRQKLITGFFINSYDVLEPLVNNNFRVDHSRSKGAAVVFNAKGETLKIRLNGENNPRVNITVKDSSGCNIALNRMDNVLVKKSSSFNVEIPRLPNGLTAEYYDIKISPQADVQIYFNDGIGSESDSHIRVGILEWRVWQFNNPKFTFGAANSTISDTATTQSNVTIFGQSNSYSSETPGFTKSTHTTALVAGAGNNLYINKDRLMLPDLVTDDIAIKKTVQTIRKRKKGANIECVNEFDVVAQGSSDGSTVNSNTSLEVGMKYSGEIKRTKKIIKLVDIEEHLVEPCDKCDKKLDKFTNELYLSNTHGLFPGMKVTGVNVDGAPIRNKIKEIKCKNIVILETKGFFTRGSQLTFTYKAGGSIASIEGNRITSHTCVKLENQMALSFYRKDKPSIDGQVKFSKSGDTSMVITTTINRLYFGQDDVTYTLSPDLFVTDKPNAFDQHIVVDKNNRKALGGGLSRSRESDTIHSIDFVKLDTDYNKYSKTLTITQDPKRGKLEFDADSGVYYRNYTPNPGFTGKDKIKFTVSDGVNASEEKTIYITIK